MSSVKSGVRERERERERENERENERKKRERRKVSSIQHIIYYFIASCGSIGQSVY